MENKNAKPLILNTKSGLDLVNPATGVNIISTAHLQTISSVKKQRFSISPSLTEKNMMEERYLNLKQMANEKRMRNKKLAAEIKT